MAQNRMAGKGKSNNHKGTGRDYSKEKAFQSSPAQVDYRQKLNKANRDAGTYGKMNKMGKDRSHTKDGKMVLEDKSKNRSRNGRNGKSTKK